MKTLIIIIGIILGTILVISNSAKALDYAWAVGGSLDDKCMVIVWIRGQIKDKDYRVIYESKKTKNMCTVYVDPIEFEKNFKYCVLSGIKVYDGAKGYNASFGGGLAGDREQYWFEWGDPDFVKPDFYCIMK